MYDPVMGSLHTKTSLFHGLVVRTRCKNGPFPRGD